MGDLNFNEKNNASKTTTKIGYKIGNFLQILLQVLHIDVDVFSHKPSHNVIWVKLVPRDDKEINYIGTSSFRGANYITLKMYKGHKYFFMNIFLTIFDKHFNFFLNKKDHFSRPYLFLVKNCISLVIGRAAGRKSNRISWRAKRIC